MRKELYINAVERTKSAPDFSIVPLQGKHALARCIRMEGEIGLAVEKAAVPLVNRGEALELLEKGSIAEDRGGDAGGSQRHKEIDLENSYTPESQPWERP
jgi:hypothetical protein